MKLTLSGLLLCIFFSGAFAQQCNIKIQGEIIDFHNGAALNNATVSMYMNEELIEHAFTVAAGTFSFTNLCTGTYRLEISHVACISKSIVIDLYKDTFQKIHLEHHLEELEETVITGNTRGGVEKTTHKQSITTEQIESFSNASLGDALKKISGVSSLNTGSTIVKPVIQGLNGSRIAIIANEVRLQDQEWGIEHAPNFDINTANRITVIKGSGALRYGGDAIGGIVIAQPKALAVTDTLFGKTILTSSSNGRGGSINSSIDKGFNNGFGLRVQGAYKQFGDFRAPNYLLTNTGTKQLSGSLQTGIKTFRYGTELYYSYYSNTSGILRSADFGNVTDLVNAIESDIPLIIEDFSHTIAPPKQEVEHHILKSKSYFRLERFGKVSFQYAFQSNLREEFDNRRGDRSTIPVVDLTLKTHHLDVLFNIDAIDNLKIKAGITGLFQDNFADPDTGVRRVIPDYKKWNAGVFGGVSFTIANNWLIDVGTRIDQNRIDAKKFYRTGFFNLRGYATDFSDIIVEDFGTQVLTNPVFNYTNISTTLGGSYKWAEQTLSFNYGRASRPPNPSELFSEGLNLSSVAFELGDLRIQEEVSNKFSFSYQGSWVNDKIKVSTTTYANIISGFIALEPTSTITTSRGAFQVFEYLQNDAQLFGVDIDASLLINSHLSYTSQFSYLYGQDTKRDRPLINIPPANWLNTIKYTKPEWNDLTLSLRSEWFFKQTRFPNNNFETQIVDANQITTTLVDISTPPPGYHLWHLDTSVKINLDRTLLKVGVSVNNILNTQYRQYLNRFRFFADELGRNLTLNLKINY